MARYQALVAVIVLVSIAGSLVPVTFTPAPRLLRAEAIIPVGDVTNLPTHIANLFQSILQTIRQIYEWAQTFLLAALKKRILDMIVDQIIKWIQGGGKPKFVTDPAGFFEDVGNAAINDVVRASRLAFICEPFGAQLRLALGVGFSPFPVPTFSQEASCTLDRITGNIRNFYTDFRNGSFAAFQAAWKPQNNIYGGLLITYDRELRTIAEKQDLASKKVSWSDGFTPQEKCRALPNGENRCVIMTPGRTLGDMVSRGLAADIDYIVNADQLSDYISAIADAALNRAIQEGLAAMSAGNAPPGGVFSGSGACAGLSGAALALCRNYQQSSGGPGGGQGVYTVELDQVITERGRATTTIAALIRSLQTYGRVLDNPGPSRGFLQELTALSCVNRDAYLAEVRTDIAWARDQITQLTARLTQNQTIITALQAARPRILLLVPPARSVPDFPAIEAIVAPLRQNGMLDISAAINEGTRVATIEGEVSQRISLNTQTFLDNIAECSQPP